MKFLKTKKQKVIFGIVAGVLLLIIILMISSLFKSKSNYFDDIDAIVNNDLGTFKYVIDVRTSEHTEDTEIKADSVDINNIENVTLEDETKEEDTNSNDGSHSGSFNDNWNNKDQIKATDWQYPNYKLTIEGVTTSLDPYTTQIKISLATEYFNDILTELICLDGNYYMNIEQLRYWLVQSQDSYLVSLGKAIPEGSKYLVIPESDFVFYSRYAEVDEIEDSAVVGLPNITRRLKNILLTVTNKVSQEVDSKCVYTSSDINYFIVDDGSDVLNAIKFCALNGGDFYTSVLSNSKKTYTEKGYAQALNEKDNIIYALQGLTNYLQIVDFNSTNLSIQGASRRYSNSKGNDVIEATLNTAMTANNVDYKVNCSLMRSGDTAEILVPQGSQISFDKYVNKSLIRETLNKICDYLNVTCIKTSVSLDLTTENIRDLVIDKFIELVNAQGTADFYITRNNYMQFVEKYINYKETKDSTENEKANAKLVADFCSDLNKVTGNMIKYIEKDEEVVVDKYTKVESQINGVDITLTVDEEASKSNLLVVDAVFKNTVDEEVTIKLTDISVKTLLSSSYPCNNEIILRDYNNNFDFSNVHKEVKVTGDATEKLYFVLQSDTGYMDIWYGDTNLGEIINH